MIANRIYIENQKYKEYEDTNVGIDYVCWDDDSDGYIYFEEDHQGNRSEAFYKTLSEAMDEFQDSVHFYREKE